MLYLKAMLLKYLQFFAVSSIQPQVKQEFGCDA